jgi:ABC-type amino acid transport substrate-binding protein
VVFGRAGDKYTSLEELHGKLVAHLRGAHYDDAFAADKAIKKYYTTSYQHSLDMFLKKRVDAIIAPKLGILFAAKRRGMPLDMFGEPLMLNYKISYLFFSKKNMDAETLKILRQTLGSLREAGVLDEIRAKYFRLLYSKEKDRQ